MGSHLISDCPLSLAFLGPGEPEVWNVRVDPITIIPEMIK